MKKVLSLFFAAAMILSVVFIGDALSSNNAMSAQAQVTVKRKKRGIASRSYRGGKYVYRKARNGTVYVYRKSAKGTMYVGKKTSRVTKKVYSKSSNGVRKVFRKTKKAVE